MPSQPGYKHGDNPKKAMVRGTISYLESQGLPVNKTAIFKHFELSRSQGYAALNDSASKRNDPEWEETRGRPTKVSESDQQKMEKILWDINYEDVNLNWTGLAKEAGVDMTCNRRTLHRTMGTIGYRRCLTCGRSWAHMRNRERRSEWATKMLSKYPQPENWRNIRFSNELHFGFGLDGKMRLLPRPGEKVCATCEESSSSETWARDIKRVHAWGAIGYGFKSDLVFYEPSTSPNGTGTMTMSDYHDKILEKAVKPWLGPSSTNAQRFVLEEDTDAFAHGSLSKVNIVQQWKHVHNLQYFFSSGDSPDLSPLDSLWPPDKQWTLGEKLADWEDETLKAAVKSVWAGLEQERINMWVDVMPQRLQQIVGNDGRFMPW